MPLGNASLWAQRPEHPQADEVHVCARGGGRLWNMDCLALCLSFTLCRVDIQPYLLRKWSIMGKACLLLAEVSAAQLRARRVRDKSSLWTRRRNVQGHEGSQHALSYPGIAWQVAVVTSAGRSHCLSLCLDFLSSFLSTPFTLLPPASSLVSSF